ncbi:hypothetical protein B0H19DRAFT_1252930 [Mycena capillaripes]|nr:hypothetical protein B0H19DRAFT_1252930 [Mycena capillaripes]
MTPLISNVLNDPSRSSTPKFRLKEQFVQLDRVWLWEAANRALAVNANESGAERYSKKEKEIVLAKPRLLDATAYPTRPASLPPASRSYTRLREVLARAASLSDEETRDDLEMHEDHVEGETTYFWKADYMVDLFNSLIAIIGEHGIEGAGWKSARWEVYDTHTRCILPLYFSHRDDMWYDEAKEWLSGLWMQR